MKLMLFTCITLLPMIAFSQTTDKEVPTHKFELDVGYNGRITPVYLRPYFGSIPDPGTLMNTDQHDHLTGSGFNTTITYGLHRWFAAFGYSVRYDHIQYAEISNPTPGTVVFEENQWMSDFHFDIGRELYGRNNWSIIAFAGINAMNNGTSYAEYHEQMRGNDTTMVRSKSNLFFAAWNAGLRFQKGNFGLALNMYHANGVGPLIQDGPFLLPELRIRYTIAGKRF